MSINDKRELEIEDIVESGRTEPAFGSSDSSDSASDMPADAPDTDSDRNNTGERTEVENTTDDPASNDVQPDKIVPEDQAGLGYSVSAPEETDTTVEPGQTDAPVDIQDERQEKHEKDPRAELGLKWPIKDTDSDSKESRNDQ